MVRTDIIEEKGIAMKRIVRHLNDISPLEFLRLRERLGFECYRKTTKRSEEKRTILLRLNLIKIAENEKDDFIVLGCRRRRIFL